MVRFRGWGVRLDGQVWGLGCETRWSGLGAGV